MLDVQEPSKEMQRKKIKNTETNLQELKQKENIFLRKKAEENS
mgnify:CR=1 FL=1